MRLLARRTASVFQTHYLITAKTYQRDNVRERDRVIFKTVKFSSRRSSRLTCRIGRHVGVWIVTRFSSRVPRRVPNRARFGVL